MEYLHYIKTLDFILIGFIAVIVLWNVVEHSMRR